MLFDSILSAYKIIEFSSEENERLIKMKKKIKNQKCLSKIYIFFFLNIVFCKTYLYTNSNYVQILIENFQ
jgi:hypothetical protein